MSLLRLIPKISYLDNERILILTNTRTGAYVVPDMDQREMHLFDEILTGKDISQDKVLGELFLKMFSLLERFVKNFESKIVHFELYKDENDKYYMRTESVFDTPIDEIDVVIGLIYAHKYDIRVACGKNLVCKDTMILFHNHDTAQENFHSRELFELKILLKHYLDKENYEKAAEVRDGINRRKKENKITNQ